MRREPSAWEAQCVSETRQRCYRTAASIGGLARIGLTAEDAQQLLALAVVAACRAWAEDHQDKPTPAYLNWAIRCRKLKLWTAIRKATERGCDLEPDPKVPDQAYNPADLVEKSERREIAVAWEAVIQHRLSPTDFALLRLRAEGYTNSEIESLSGLLHGDNAGVRRRYYEVKKKAADFLRSCGIDTSEAAIDAPMEKRHAAWKKAIKKAARK